MRTILAPVLLILLLAPTTPGPVRAQVVLDLRPSERFDGEPFSRIRGLVSLGNGSVLVVDPIENGLFRVDPQQGTRLRIGREGPGPNEYDRPTDVGPWMGDSVLVSDLRNGRLAVLDRDLRMVRTMPMTGPGYSIPRESDGLARLYFDLSVGVRLERQRSASRLELAPLVRWDPAAERADTIARIRVPIGASAGPFPQRDEWGVGSDGWVAIVRNQEAYRLDWVRPDGHTVEGPVVHEERLEVSARDRALWLEDNGGQGGRLGVPGASAGSSVSFPDYLPRVRWGGVHVGPGGRAWVVRQQPLEDRRPLLDVFNAEGERIGRVRLPERREIVGVDGAALWAVYVDEVDLQWLERYELPDFR